MSLRKCYTQGGEANLRPRQDCRRHAQARNHHRGGRDLPIREKSEVHGVSRRLFQEPHGPYDGEVWEIPGVRPRGLQTSPRGSYRGGLPD